MNITIKNGATFITLEKKSLTRSSTGVKGVYFYNSTQKYCSKISYKKKIYYLGIFNTLDEATAVRHAAENAKANNRFEEFLEQLKLK